MSEVRDSFTIILDNTKCQVGRTMQIRTKLFEQIRRESRAKGSENEAGEKMCHLSKREKGRNHGEGRLKWFILRTYIAHLYFHEWMILKPPYSSGTLQCPCKLCEMNQLLWMSHVWYRNRYFIVFTVILTEMWDIVSQRITYSGILFHIKISD